MTVIKLMLILAVSHKITQSFMTDLQKEFIDILNEFGFDIFSIKMIKDCNRLPKEELINYDTAYSKMERIVKNILKSN